jgi:large subunit ribosomal protein L25
VIGESPGVKNGGVLQMVVREIPVSCLPSDIPSFIEVNSSALEIGDSLRIQEVELPAKVSISTDENYAVISIVGRAKEEEEEEIVAVEEGEEGEGESERENSADEKEKIEEE